MQILRQAFKKGGVSHVNRQAILRPCPSIRRAGRDGSHVSKRCEPPVECHLRMTLMRLLSVVGHPISFNVSGGNASSARSIFARRHAA
ncbi:hypothetical protein AGR7C_Cc110452 [Agrobacterium deltaense Zutra 3/1]|uniref:Uncharacterized protein n=1 Tax=Agrobacterium deltaense Zutra 3/1 TaxID=1183427 RepID=A0A1S7P6J2_9HYPH|nr:hypothetical protein AGR7C_Cc110452 [Agrobacterium deltaense Zutra 3/1]